MFSIKSGIVMRIVFNQCWNFSGTVYSVLGSGIAQERKWVNVQSCFSKVRKKRSKREKEE